MECRGRNRPTMRVFTPSARCWEPFGGRRVLSAPENAKLRAKIMLMNRLIFIGLGFLVLLWRSEVLVGNSRISPLGRLNSRLGRCKFPVRAATGICWQGLDRPYFLRTNRSSAGGSGENSRFHGKNREPASLTGDCFWSSQSPAPSTASLRAQRGNLGVADWISSLPVSRYGRQIRSALPRAACWQTPPRRAMRSGRIALPTARGRAPPRRSRP